MLMADRFAPGICDERQSCRSTPGWDGAPAITGAHSLPLPRARDVAALRHRPGRSEEHTSELQSLMRISYAVFCLKKKKKNEDKSPKCIVRTTYTLYSSIRHNHSS